MRARNKSESVPARARCPREFLPAKGVPRCARDLKTSSKNLDPDGLVVVGTGAGEALLAVVRAIGPTLSEALLS